MVNLAAVRRAAVREIGRPIGPFRNRIGVGGASVGPAQHGNFTVTRTSFSWKGQTMQSTTSGVRDVVLVHGAFADGSCWAKVIPTLVGSGLNVTASQNPMSSLADDVAAVGRALDMRRGPVLLVAHSLGGVAATEAGNDPRVAGLIYVAAAAPDAGQSFGDWLGGRPPMPVIAQIYPVGQDGFLALTRQGMFEDVAQDLTEDEQSLLLAAQKPTAGRCFSDKVGPAAAWRAKPSWYVVAERDRTLPPDAERESARRMEATTLTLASGHMPMMSHPREVADFIRQAADTLAGHAPGGVGAA
jgi:pimeloyl-ACP methyl ester carboxylesterase